MIEYGPIRKRSEANSDEHNRYVHIARVLLGQLKHRMSLLGLTSLSAQHYLPGGVFMKVSSIFGHDEVMIRYPDSSSCKKCTNDIISRKILTDINVEKTQTYAFYEDDSGTWTPQFLGERTYGSTQQAITRFNNQWYTAYATPWLGSEGTTSVIDENFSILYTYDDIAEGDHSRYITGVSKEVNGNIFVGLGTTDGTESGAVHRVSDTWGREKEWYLPTGTVQMWSISANSSIVATFSMSDSLGQDVLHVFDHDGNMLASDDRFDDLSLGQCCVKDRYIFLLAAIGSESTQKVFQFNEDLTEVRIIDLPILAGEYWSGMTVSNKYMYLQGSDGSIHGFQRTLTLNKLCDVVSDSFNENLDELLPPVVCLGASHIDVDCDGE